MEVPFAVKAYSETLILNQQPLTLGAVLENDPSVRTSLGFGNASEQFVIRGFPLYGEDIAIDGLYGVTPRQLVSPELYEIGRAHVCTPVPNAHLVCRLLLAKKYKTSSRSHEPKLSTRHTL